MAGVMSEQPMSGRVTVPIVALDFADAATALAMVRKLGSSCRFYKVGSELFTAAGPAVIEAVRSEGCDVFLDLKLHDIPNTVAAAIRRIVALDVRLTTVHASGGRAMIEAAAEAAGEKCAVFAVTVLTSLDATALAETVGIHGDSLHDTVLRLAALASSSGARGVVCSGNEAAALRERFGATLELLVPGIRLAGDDVADQSRVVTPAGAMSAGADYIVIGRSVTAAPDAVLAMQRVLDQLAGADA